MKRILITILLLATCASAAAGVTSKRGEYAWTPDRVTASSRPPMFDQLRESAGNPIFTVEAAPISAPDQLEAIRLWNRNNLPIRGGFSHALAPAAHVLIDQRVSSVESAGKGSAGHQYGQVMQTAGGDLLWSTSVRVDDSYRLRLNLSNVDLPEKARLWVYSEAEEVVGPFGQELADSRGDIWTPSVAGPVIHLVVMLPAGSPPARFTIGRVAETFKLGSEGEPLPGHTEDSHLSCLVQSLCVDTDTFAPIADVEKAIGRMEWVTGEFVNWCTGGLINDNDDSTTIPYFLTANHCFTTQDIASSMEVFWDYRPDECNGTAPELSSLARSNGATIKATGVPSDFLLLELNSIPADRFFLGWTLEESAFAPGEVLHRVHNPGGEMQSYAQTTVEGGVHECDGDWTDATHIWSALGIGATTGGSSGSPVLTAAGDIVGQLSGSCGGNENEECNPELPTIDGKLVSYWSEVAPFLDPGNTPETGDLSLAALDAADGSYSPGGTISVTSRVDNLDSNASASYRITYYASTDTSITAGDNVMGFVDRQALGANSFDQFTVNVTIPANLPAGNYFIGAILTVTDPNANNNTLHDPVAITITVTSSGFQINAGLNGSWYDPAMDGQGFLIDVLPQNNLVFMAWFTFDLARPPGSYTATLGEPGHRWLTAVGTINGNQVEMKIDMTSGGVFASGTPAVTHDSTYGTITLTFLNCNQATIAYNIPGVGSGVINVVRIAPDNVPLCDSLNQAAQ